MGLFFSFVLDAMSWQQNVSWGNWKIFGLELLQIIFFLFNTVCLLKKWSIIQ
jgi:hypothetical protein